MGLQLTRFGRDDKEKGGASIWGRLPWTMDIRCSENPGAGGGCRHEASTSRSTDRLEHELPSELNEPRIVQLATRDSESRTIGFATSGSRWAELDAIKRIEEFRPELQTEPFTRTEVRRLLYREVPVIDPFASKVRVHARLVPETKVAGSCEASRVEPGDAPRRCYVRGTLGASWHNIRAQSPDSQTRL
jgi:hypothetical protein